MFIESRLRSAAKAFSWRVSAIFGTTIVVFLLTKKPVIALAVGGIEFVGKILLYFVHERVWSKVAFGRKEIKPFVVWLTGLPYAGKTSLAKGLLKSLSGYGLRIEHLDGIKIREILPGVGYTKEERDFHIKRVGHLASLLERNGVIVIVSMISPYKESREFVRALCNNFIEIYVSTPLKACMERDEEGMYRKAAKGEIKNFTGVSAPYEAPQAPHLRLDLSRNSVSEGVERIKEFFKNKKLIQ